MCMATVCTVCMAMQTVHVGSTGMGAHLPSPKPQSLPQQPTFQVG